MHDLRFALRQFALSSGVLAASFAVLTVLGFSPHRLHAAANPAENTAQRLKFALKDQFDREYTQALCAGKTAIVIEADREGSRFSGQWSDAISRALKPAANPAVQWVGVARLPWMPGFLRGFIKSKFPQDPANWTLLDWGGQLADTYRLPAKRCNVLIFGPDGLLLLHTGGREPDPAEVAKVVVAIDPVSPAKPADAPRSP